MLRIALILLGASIAAAVFVACGGGGSDEQPQPHPPVDCTKKPEACK